MSSWLSGVVEGLTLTVTSLTFTSAQIRWWDEGKMTGEPRLGNHHKVIGTIII